MILEHRVQEEAVRKRLCGHRPLAYQKELQRAHDLARELSELQTLEGRREQLDRVKFEKLKDPSHRLNCLLPQKRVYSHDVRAKLEYPLPRCHNNRFRKDCIVNMLYKQQGF